MIKPFTMPLQPVQLAGFGIVLQPLQLTHAAGLASAAADGQLWHLIYTSIPAPGEETAYIQTALEHQQQGLSLAFAILDNNTGQVIGTTRYCNIVPECARLEIGYTWYAQSYQRTFANTASKYLLMCHAFETLATQTIGWRTDIINTRSQAAIERLGAKKDGVIRGDMLRKDGTLRDSVIYSMCYTEWIEICKNRLQQKLQNYQV